MEDKKRQKLQEEEKVEKAKALRMMLLRIGAIVIIGMVVIFLFFDSSTFGKFGKAVVVVTALCMIYGVVARYLSYSVDRRMWKGNPYHNFFFRGTAVLTMVLTLLGVVGAFFVYVEHDNLFQAVGLVTSIIWIGAFLMYFMWAVYHYNINYGITDEDWDKIYKAQGRFKRGLPVRESELEAPRQNPYRSQTFGLPPGTVRGMIAFTLLIGGMSLLIVSFGTEYSGPELALIRQQFEFFETAFLMMIAFYFGDKSLRYLGNRWSKTNRSDPQPGEEGDRSKNRDRPIGIPALPRAEGPKDAIYVDDQILLEEDQEFTETRDVERPAPAKAWDTMDQQPLSAFQPFNKDIEYVQIMDNLHQRVLSDEDIKIALENLKEQDGIILSFPVVKAVVSVESAGRG